MKTMVELLLSLADDLQSRGVRNSAFRRRAVSTAYYSVFHALARLCADELIGKNGRSSRDYERVYRSLDHGPLKSAFERSPLKDDPSLREIGDYVVALQSARHKADYMPPKRDLLRREECLELIEAAKSAIERLKGLGPTERRTLSVHLLFKNRVS
jgi:uncharacterized protein (UPF0332 family)